jgi:hypothetical protein
MRIFFSMLPAVVLSACASSSAPVEPAGPRSYSERMAEANQHDRDAAVHDRQAAEARKRVDPTGVACGHPVVSTVADQSTSGGERISSWVPCWSVERDAASFHAAEADRLHREALLDRAVARKLLEAETQLCQILPAGELTHTPFLHREDVAAVEPYVEAGKTKGARIHFKPVSGLDANWMRQALRCHRARAAVIGYDPKFMAYDPTMLANVNVTVTEHDSAVDVVVRSDDDITAAVVSARAKDLLEPARAPE